MQAMFHVKHRLQSTGLKPERQKKKGFILDEMAPDTRAQQLDKIERGSVSLLARPPINLSTLRAPLCHALATSWNFGQRFVRMLLEILSAGVGRDANAKAVVIDASGVLATKRYATAPHHRAVRHRLYK